MVEKIPFKPILHDYRMLLNGEEGELIIIACCTNGSSMGDEFDLKKVKKINKKNTMKVYRHS